ARDARNLTDWTARGRTAAMAVTIPPSPAGVRPVTTLSLRDRLAYAAAVLFRALRRRDAAGPRVRPLPSSPLPPDRRRPRRPPRPPSASASPPSPPATRPTPDTLRPTPAATRGRRLPEPPPPGPVPGHG